MTAQDKLDLFNIALNAWVNKSETDKMIDELRNDWRELKDCTDAQSIDARRIIERELTLLGGMGSLTSTGFVAC